MLVIHVNIRVKPEHVEAFKQATLVNARQSVQEPGIAGFQVLQHAQDPTRFIFLEVYRTSDAPAKHKETAHYQVWNNTVAPMMAEARERANYSNVFPADSDWH